MTRQAKLCIVLVWLMLWFPAAVADASFQLERVDGSSAREGIGMTRVVAQPTFLAPPPRPVAKVAVRLATAPVVEPGSHRSVNPMVRTQGCEARHAQQFNPSGKYWGWYQFDRQTWAAHGGDPDEYGRASTAEQDRVAARVKYDAWPNC